MEIENSFVYTVLIFQDECGTWLKAPEFNLQMCTDDLDDGIEYLEELIDYEVRTRKDAGEVFPERFEQTIRLVSKDEYGPTLAEMADEGEFDWSNGELIPVNDISDDRLIDG